MEHLRQVWSHSKPFWAALIPASASAVLRLAAHSALLTARKLPDRIETQVMSVGLQTIRMQPHAEMEAVLGR